MTHDGTHLIMSDGTHVIRFVDPETFKTMRTIVVSKEKGSRYASLTSLNTSKAKSGRTSGIGRTTIDTDRPGQRQDYSPGSICPSCVDEQMDSEDVENTDVLNGIAYDAAADRIFVTGKNMEKALRDKIKTETIGATLSLDHLSLNLTG